MNQDILKMKPSNLPVYTYSLNVRVVVCFRSEYFRISESLNFNLVRVAINSPLVDGDILSNNSCYYGNSNVELTPYIKGMFQLGLLESLPWEYRYCHVDSISRVKNFIPINADNEYMDCGEGKGTVFIDVICPDAINDAIEEKVQFTELRSYEVEFDSPYHWSNLFPEWYGKALVYLGRQVEGLGNDIW
jgi:hypothetical protein